MEYQFGDIRVLYDESGTNFNMTETHTHEDYELYYLFNGERLFFINDRVHSLVSGSMAYADAAQAHRVFSSTQQPHVRMVLHVRKSALKGRMAQLAKPFEEGGCVSLAARERFAFEKILGQIAQECNGQGCFHHLMVELLAKQALVFLYRKHEAIEAQPKFGGAVIVQAIAYINAHYAQPLNLNDICKRLNISTSHFTRLFKASTGHTFVAYVNNLRIKKASELLVSTHMPVSVIASETGFASFSYFGKVFRQWHGISPLQYRKQQGVSTVEPAEDSSLASSE